jgi:hypothetical protein
MREPGKTSPIDGHFRSLRLELELNQTAARVFTSGGGRDFLDYLKTITTGTICRPTDPDSYLRHMEGARWLVAVIQQRVKAGQKQGAIGYVPPGPDDTHDDDDGSGPVA